MFAVQRAEIFDRVAQGYQIVRHDVVRVRLLNLFGQLPSLWMLAEPEEVIRELSFCGEKFRVEFQRHPLKLRSFGKSVFLRELAADEVWNAWIFRPQFECRGSSGDFA